MDEQERSPGHVTFLSELSRELREKWHVIRFGLSSANTRLRNRLRLARGLKLDYVVFTLSGPFPERSGPPRGFLQRQLPLPPKPLSLETLNRQLSVVNDATNVKGVLFIFQGLGTGIATLQNLRTTIERLQAVGKEVVVYTPYLDLSHYYVASAADRVIAPPTSSFNVVGLRAEVAFLKDTLDKIGIEADVLQISPYKTAYDMYDKATATAEQKEQINWILDDFYDQLTKSIALSRGFSQEALIQLIDRSPLSAQDALEAGLLDDLAYEDSIPRLLADQPRVVIQEDSQESESQLSPTESEGALPMASLKNWVEARNVLLEKKRQSTEKYIGVISIDGDIVMGQSSRPPLESPIPIPFIRGTSAGEVTLSRILRRSEKDKRLAALVLYVNSPGGSPIASDLICRQVKRIAQKKPVIAYMGTTAASGGYYVCSAANYIMAQSLTTTGSIGVVNAHFNTSEMFEKIGINRVEFTRGEQASLHSDIGPLTKTERKILEEEIIRVYEQFKHVVAEGRSLDYEELDHICEGRVWTGRQALNLDLVDGLGDFEDAIRKAAEEADLSTGPGRRISVVNIHPSDRGHVLPRQFEPVQALSRLFSMTSWHRNAGRPMLLLPYRVKIG